MGHPQTVALTTFSYVVANGRTGYAFDRGVSNPIAFHIVKLKDGVGGVFVRGPKVFECLRGAQTL